MKAGQVRRWGVGDEELPSVGIGPAIGHRQQAGPVELEIRVELILKGVARPARACAGGITALGHEPARSRPRLVQFAV